MRAALLCCALLACGGVDPDAAGEADATALSPFTMQFTGGYVGSYKLLLRRDGTYQLGSEHGRFRAPRAQKSLPLALQLGARTATIEAYDGKLHVGADTLQLQRPPYADEDLCDSTHGRWTDDDADPATGLYCICPPREHFIPASGGCVR